MSPQGHCLSDSEFDPAGYFFNFIFIDLNFFCHQTPPKKNFFPAASVNLYYFRYTNAGRPSSPQGICTVPWIRGRA